jgi:hypothetical protein
VFLENPFINAPQYAEFSSYTELLRGAPPSVLTRGLVAQHRQTWKIREHVLLEGDPLAAGDALHAFIPENTSIQEVAGVATAEESGQSAKYIRCTNIPESDIAGAQDIIITGDVSMFGFDYHCPDFLDRDIPLGGNSDCGVVYGVVTGSSC